MPIDFGQIGIQAGSGVVVGAVVGYAAKKVVKIFAMLIGVQIAVLAYLESKRVVSVDWTQLQSIKPIQLSNQGGILAVFTDFISIIPVGGGFAAGALVGFKKG